MKINPSIFFLELKKENHYLLGFLNQENVVENMPKGIYLIKFNFISTEEKPKIDINSFNIIKFTNPIANLFDSRISCIELKNGNIVISYLTKDHYINIGIFENENLELLYSFNIQYYLEEDYFFKLIFLKDQKGLIFFSDDSGCGLSIMEFQKNSIEGEDFYYYGFPIRKYEATYHYCMDIMAFTETKIIILSQKFHGRAIIYKNF